MAGPTMPGRVEALAARYRLGGFVDAARGSQPVLEWTVATAAALVAFGAAWLLNRLLHLAPVRPLALLVAATALVGIALVGFGFFRLFTGSGTVHRFAGGVVRTRYGSAHAVPWTAVDELRVTRKGPDDPTVTHAGMITFDGRRIPVEDGDPARLTAFVDAVERVVRQHRRPVVSRHRFDDPEPPEVPLGTGAISVIDLAVGVALVVAVGFGLWRAGVPVPVNAIVGLVLVGVVQALIGVRFDRRIAAHGLTLLGVAGLLTMSAAARALPALDPYAVATAVLAVEMAVLSVALSLYRRLPARRPTADRRRLAAARGWSYAGTHSVTVGGPWTARNLIGVPEGCVTTTLVDVIIGAVDGVPVVIGDRVRRRPLVGDPVQTVWMVVLPQAVPYVSREDSYAGGAVADSAPNPEVAAAIRAHDRAVATLPSWWIEDRFLYAAGHADARTTLDVAVRLTRFAADLPWNDLRRFPLPGRS